jgi:hypothetical protein
MRKSPGHRLCAGRLSNLDLSTRFFSPVFFEATYAVRASLQLWESGLSAKSERSLPRDRVAGIAGKLDSHRSSPHADPTCMGPPRQDFGARIEKLIERSIGQSEKE